MREVKLKKWGNSQGIRIPKSILYEIGVEDSDDVDMLMEVADNKIVIEKKPSESKLMQRFKDYDYHKYLDNREVALDKDVEPKGRELW